MCDKVSSLIICFAKGIFKFERISKCNPQSIFCVDWFIKSPKLSSV